MTPTPPRLVPDRPSDAMRELAGSIRSVAKSTSETANRWRNHPDSPGMLKMAGLYDGWADVIELCAEAADAPPAEATAHPSRGVVGEGGLREVFERWARPRWGHIPEAFDNVPGRPEPEYNHNGVQAAWAGWRAALQAAALPADLSMTDEWVRVTERLPEEGGLVLVYIPDRGDGERFDFDFIE